MCLDLIPSREASFKANEEEELAKQFNTILRFQCKPYHLVGIEESLEIQDSSIYPQDTELQEPVCCYCFKTRLPQLNFLTEVTAEQEFGTMALKKGGLKWISEKLDFSMLMTLRFSQSFK